MNTEDLLDQVDWIRALARRLVVDPHHADDLAQDALLAAIESPPRRAHTSIRAWLATVVRHQARKRHRDDTRRRRREAHAARGEPDPRRSDDLVERAETQRRLVEAVLELPEPYRRTVLLRFFEGMDSKSIAELDAIEPATVRSRLRRGLDRLRAELAREFGHDPRGGWTTRIGLIAVSYPVARTLEAAALGTSGSASASVVLGTSGPGPSSALSKLGGAIVSTKKITIAAAASVLLVGAAYFAIDDRTKADAPRTPASPLADAQAPVDLTPLSTGPNAETVTAPGITGAPPLDVSPNGSPSETGTIHGIVVDDADDEPIERAVLHAIRVDDTGRAGESFAGGGMHRPVRAPPLDDAEHRATSDIDGRFAIDGLPPGSYAVIARSREHRTGLRKDIVVSSEAPAEASFSLGRGLAIRGVVVDANGEPVANVRVLGDAGFRLRRDGGMITVSSGNGKPVQETKETRTRPAWDASLSVVSNRKSIRSAPSIPNG